MKIRALLFICCTSLMVSAVSAKDPEGKDTPKQTIHIVKMDKRVSELMADRVTIRKDMGLKEPYVGQTILQTSEIAEDLTYYFANSEQVPSSVGLGVLMEKDNTVECAGGFIIQMMPFAKEETISQIEENLKNITSVTDHLKKGETPEQILEILLGNLGLEITDTMPTKFYCNCSKERVEKAVISVGKKEIQDMIDEGKDIEVKCHFCNTAYKYTVDELKDILKRCKR